MKIAILGGGAIGTTATAAYYLADDGHDATVPTCSPEVAMCPGQNSGPACAR